MFSNKNKNYLLIDHNCNLTKQFVFCFVTQTAIAIFLPENSECCFFYAHI